MFFSKKIVGIDIGTGSIKIAEISKWGKTKKLKNYGELKSDFIAKDALTNGALVSNNSAATAIRAILNEANIKTKEAIFSIPDFSTFYTSFDIPQMTSEEIPGAIHYNASQYITLPISEVTLDWQIMPKSPADKSSPFKVFLVAMPNKVVEDYKAIAKLSGLELYALEAEVFGITRALIKDNKKTICLVDMGAETSTINIVDAGFLKSSYSFGFSGSKLTDSLSSILKLDHNQSEEIKNKEGLLSQKNDVAKNISLLIDPLLAEIKIICEKFLQKENKEIEEIYLTGGTANLPGLKEYFKDNLKKNILIPNCFSGISYPSILEQTILEISPRFSAAVGVALYKLEH